MIKSQRKHKALYLFLSILSLIGLLLSGCQKYSKDNEIQYAIDINVYNQTDYKIDKLGLYIKGEDLEHVVPETKENENGLVHFAVTYHSDTVLLLKGTASGQEISTFEFTLEGFEQTRNPQTLIIDLVEIKGKLKLEKRK